MRTILPILCLVCVSIAGNAAKHETPLFGRLQAPDIVPRLAEFNYHWNLFFRQYIGCPRDARTVTDCDPRLGSTDVREYQAAVDAALKVFPVTR